MGEEQQQKPESNRYQGNISIGVSLTGDVAIEFTDIGQQVEFDPEQADQLALQLIWSGWESRKAQAQMRQAAQAAQHVIPEGDGEPS